MGPAPDTASRERPFPTVLLMVAGNGAEPTGRAGARSLEQVCTLLGYRARGFDLRDLRDFRQKMRFVPQLVRLRTFAGHPLMVHIDVDGDASTMQAGPDRRPWARLVAAARGLLCDLRLRQEPTILVLSTPEVAYDAVTALLRTRSAGPLKQPTHLFLFARTTASEADAILAWAHFYREMAQIDFSARSIGELPGLHRLRARLREHAFGTLHYSPGLRTRGP